ncbi:hypothetical protein ACWEJ6_45510, partial [Nonomuraea sp. NPDC004702]
DASLVPAILADPPEAVFVNRYGVAPVARAPLDLREPVLRVSPPPGTRQETLDALARVLDGH